MRRINIRRIVVAMLVGAIATVLVAWTRMFIPNMLVGSYAISPRPWPIAVPASWPSMPTRVNRLDWLGRSRLEYSSEYAGGPTDAAGEPETTGGWIIERQTGWPFRAMANYYAATITRDDQSAMGSAHSEIQLSWYLSGWEIRHHPFGLKAANYASMPFVPLWPGFMADTLFYGSIPWLLLAGLSAIKRRRRAKRGLCVQCAYPLTGGEVCPECGMAVGGAVTSPVLVAGVGAGASI